MSYNNGIITRPVVLTPTGGDIAQATGMILSSLGEYVTQAPINPWAKYKPVRFTTYEDTGISATEQPNYWKADDNMCGFTIPTDSNPGLLPSSSNSSWYKLLNSQLMWTYNRPTGSFPRQPFRQNDFDGYDHNAQPPVSGPTSDSIMLTSDNKLKVQIGTTRSGGLNSKWLSLSDFTVNGTLLSNWYVGIMLWYTNSEYAIATAGRFSDGGDFEVEFTNMQSYGGRTVKIVPFLSTMQITPGQSISAGTVVSCNVEPADVRIRVYTTGIKVDLTAIWKDSFHVRVEYTCNLINQSAAAITVTNIVIKLWRSGSQSPLDTDTYSTATIPAGGNDPLPGILINNDAYVSTDEYYVTVESTNNVATGRATVDAPRT